MVRARAAVLTLSDRVSSGVYEDVSGGIAAEMLRERLGVEVIATEVLPDDRQQIEAVLRTWSDVERYGLVITSGGTGISPTDVTPDATLAVVDYVVPGMAEVMRAVSLRKTPMAALSRAVVGVRGRTLIINLPGSPKGVRECLEAILPVLPHALEQLASGGGHS
ncbi:MAG TPA: MogA/MoaB family molybdenum cofactor biosynthesis protein [Chloroflexia bacterium]|nr:MogA/MoaB family molybdenum cofactor biosynthesis protein [Chloroflexia bacterium]